jgi:hypothetical protein
MMYGWIGFCVIGFLSAVSALSYCQPGQGVAIFGVLALFGVIPLALGAGPGPSPKRMNRETMDALRHRLAVAEAERARQRSGGAPPPP